MASNPGNGRYLIYPERNLDEPLAVRCEFDSDGAWTVRMNTGFMMSISICICPHSYKTVVLASFN